MPVEVTRPERTGWQAWKGSLTMTIVRTREVAPNHPRATTLDAIFAMYRSSING